jgi:hypothetical protein
VICDTFDEIVNLPLTRVMCDCGERFTTHSMLELKIPMNTFQERLPSQSLSRKNFLALELPKISLQNSDLDIYKLLPNMESGLANSPIC